MKIIIIGGGSAGTTCAFELRKLNKEHEITVIEKGENTEYSPCAMPYVLSGEIPDKKDILIKQKQDYEENNIELLLETKAEKIDRDNKKVILKNGRELEYDKLVLATGSKPIKPSIKGLEEIKTHNLCNYRDMEKIQEKMKHSEEVAIIGAGMIGIEAAQAMKKRNKEVKVFERKNKILPYLFDEKMAKKIEEHLEGPNLDIQKSTQIQEIKENKIKTNKEEYSYDTIILAAGVRANTELAEKANLETKKAIVTNKKKKTEDPDIYAIGDCSLNEHSVTGERTISPLGTTAFREGKFTARHINGSKEEFPPVLNTTVSNVAGLCIGSTGLMEEHAEETGCISATYTGEKTSSYYPEDSEITVKLISSEEGELIGAQAASESDISGTMNWLTFAIKEKTSIEKIARSETCYNPAVASIINPVATAAQVLEKKFRHMKK